MRSMPTLRLLLLTAVCVLNLGPLAATAAETPSRGATPFAIPTFHCLGLYWSPPGGAADKEVLVRYRRQGAAEWKEGLPMRYNPIPKTDEDLTDYRGSIVHLTPATTYEVQLTLAGTADHREPHRHDLERGVSRWARRSAWATATRRWRSPSPARPTATASMTARARRSTCATSTTRASRSTPPT